MEEANLWWIKEPHKGTGIGGIYSARQRERERDGVRERETEAKERQVVWVERLWVGSSSTELLQRLSHSNQRERERESEVLPFRVKSPFHPASLCLSLRVMKSSAV